MKKVLLLLFAGFSLCAAEVNVLKNSNFEEVKNGRFVHWGYNGKDRKNIAVDANVKHSGKYSLRVNSPVSFCALTQRVFKAADFKNDIIIRGWAKYKGMEKVSKEGNPRGFPFVGIWSYRKGRNNTSFNVIPIAVGDRDWFRFEKRIKAEDFRKRVAAMRTAARPDSWGFRINVFNQQGMLWLDDLEMIFVKPVIFKVLLDRNSVSGDDNANLSIETGEKGSAAVTDAKGKTVFSRKFNSGKTAIALPAASWANGSYTIKVIAGKNSQVLKLTKVADAFDE